MLGLLDIKLSKVIILYVLFKGMDRYPPIKSKMPVDAFCGEIAEGDLQVCTVLCR